MGSALERTTQYETLRCCFNPRGARVRALEISLRDARARRERQARLGFSPKLGHPASEGVNPLRTTKGSGKNPTGPLHPLGGDSNLLRAAVRRRPPACVGLDSTHSIR